MRVTCQVEEIELEGDYEMIASVCVTCDRCGHEAEAYGTSGRSIRRCLVMLREECPEDESNYYVADGSEDD